MTGDDLTARFDTAFRRHWRTCMDRNGPTPALLAECVTIAEEHATSPAAALAQVAGYKIGDQFHHPSDVIVVLDSPRVGEPVPPPARLAAASEPQPAPAVSTGTASRRTRARTRGGPK